LMGAQGVGLVGSKGEKFKGGIKEKKKLGKTVWNLGERPSERGDRNVWKNSTSIEKEV